MTGLAQISCLHCAQPLGDVRVVGGYLLCPHCGTAYPVVEDKVPVFVPAPLHALAQAYWLYHHQLQLGENTAVHLQKLATRTPAMAASLHRLADAYRRNLAPFQRLQQAVRPFITPDALLQAFDEQAHKEAATYGVQLTYYLEKDWSGQPATEKELARKLAPVLAQSRHAPDRASVVVLGAGAGRVAWELGYAYHQVYAVDTSLLMVYNYGRLQQEDISFCSIKTNNVVDDQYRVRELTASLRACGHDPQTFAANAGRITYFLGDATRLPLPDQSQSAVVSVYFTDVLPLRAYLGEVRRLLKPGGVFIHVGPLIYHFDDESQMLTPDEVLAVFREYGFTIQTNETTTSTSALTVGTMVSTTYTNWVFTAVYPPQVPAPLLDVAAVVRLSAPLAYEIQGQLWPEDAATPAVLLQVAAGEKFAISELLLDLLRLVDGRSSLAQLLTLLAEEYELPDEAPAVLLDSLQQLRNRGVITICT